MIRTISRFFKGHVTNQFAATCSFSTEAVNRQITITLTISKAICLGCVVMVAGCDSESSLDSMMSRDESFPSQVQRNSSATDAAAQMGVDGDAVSRGDSTSERGATVDSAGASSTVGQESDRRTWAGDAVIGIDHPRISRENFVVKLSIPARELLLEQTQKPGQAFLLVGKVTPTVDDWRHVSFVDFYESDRQYQFRTNGVKILVPRELVNKLHNATIDLDPATKTFFVTLDR